MGHVPAPARTEEFVNNEVDEMLQTARINRIMPAASTLINILRPYTNTMQLKEGADKKPAPKALRN
jgi:hypothetical protein